MPIIESFPAVQCSEGSTSDECITLCFHSGISENYSGGCFIGDDGPEYSMSMDSFGFSTYYTRDWCYYL